MGNDYPPYRQACQNLPVPSCGLGPLYKHGKASEKGIDRYVNTTLIPNWNTEVGGTIAPYERWTIDLSGGDSCEVHFCVEGGAPCNAWEQPFAANTFANTPGDKIDFSLCRKTGFKNVQAKRSWHGVFPWTAPEAGCNTDQCDDGSGWQSYQSTPTQTKYLTVTYNVSFNNHFDAGDSAGSSFSGSITGSRTVDANSGKITSTLLTQTHGVNAGEEPLPITSDIVGGVETVTDPNEGGGTTVTDGVSTILDDQIDYHCTIPRYRADAATSLPALIALWNSPDFDGTGIDGDTLPAMSNPNNYSATASGTTNGGTMNWTADLTFSRTATTVSWDFTVHQYNGTDEDNTWSHSGTVTLSNPNTVSTVYTDIKDNLLSLWPLNDDKLYPWRTDLKVSLAPLVSRNEKDNTSPIGFNPYTVGGSPWADTSTCDGSILGAPKPAGYENYFDFGFNDVRGCCFRPADNPGFQTWSWYQVGWGQNVSTFNLNSGSHLPLNATQWNNWFQAANKPVGAWIFYADKGDYFGSGCVSSGDGAHAQAGDAGSIVACKWAETMEVWKSQNFARPAGDDKFSYDENRVYCCTNVEGAGEGSTWTISQGVAVDDVNGNPPTDPDWIPTYSAATPPDGTDFTGYWGGPSVNGFYSVSGYSGGVLTLGAKVFDVPSNWASKSNGDDSLCFGKLRFPTAASLLGRIAITTTGPGTTFTFTEAQPNFGMDSATHQEQIDLYDATFTLLASNVTATRVDDTHFTVVSGEPTAKWVQIHGAAKWYINDTSPKGDYAVLEWESDFRTKGEYDRLAGMLDCSGTAVAQPTENRGGGDVANLFRSFTQTAACLPFKQCAPRVVCISPNGETWGNGTTYDFPETFEADEQYGSKWWGYVQQTMTDLFWQQPHRPCNIEDCARWTMDAGLCADDTAGTCPPAEDAPAPEYFFGHAPQVEARLTVPDNYGMAQDESAPALPAGVQVGWSSPVDHAYGDGDVAFPPTPPGPESDTGRPGGVVLASTLHATLCENSACARFDYATPGC